MQLTLEQLTAIMPYGKARLPKFIDALNKWMPKYGINSPERAAAFLAQLAHESGEFRYVRELGSDAYLEKYDTGRLATALGNTPADDGDGQKYRGRGLIQITGAYNYRRVSKALFGDDRLLKTPELLEQPEWAVASACWFWCEKGLNDLADRGEFRLITRRINGGTNGLDERMKYWAKAKEILGVVG